MPSPQLLARPGASPNHLASLPRMSKNGNESISRQCGGLIPQSHSRIICSTKRRQSWLSDRTLRGEMQGVLGALCNSLGCPLVLVGGVEDHVHIACHLGRTRTVADLIKELKRELSLWAKEKSPSVQDFEWQ